MKKLNYKVLMILTILFVSQFASPIVNAAKGFSEITTSFVKPNFKAAREIASVSEIPGSDGSIIDNGSVDDTNNVDNDDVNTDDTNDVDNNVDSVVQKDTTPSINDVVKSGDQQNDKTRPVIDTITNPDPKAPTASSTGKWGTTNWTFDNNTGTLTVSGGGTLFGNPPYASTRGNINPNNIKKIVFTDPEQVTSNIMGMFSSLNDGGDNIPDSYTGLANLEEIDGLEKLDTTKMTDMSSMFAGDGKLTRVDLSGLNTSNVTSMYRMFDGDGKLTEVDLSSFDTSNVTSMYKMFYGNASLPSIDISNFDTNKVTNMQQIFMGLTNASNINMNMSTQNVTNMQSMFANDGKLMNVDLEGFNTSKVTDMRQMFLGDSSLKNLDLSSFDTSKASRQAMLGSLDSIESLTLGSGFTHDTNNSSKLGLAHASYPTNGNWTKDDGKNAPVYTPDGLMNAYGTGTIGPGRYIAEGKPVDDKPLWGTSPWTFDKDSGTLYVEAGKLDPNDSGTKTPWTRTDDKKIKPDDIKQISFIGEVEAPSNSTCLFAQDKNSAKGLKNLTKIDRLDLLNTSNVTNMNSMFFDDVGLTDLDLSKFDTKNVTDMSKMFNGDTGLTSFNFPDTFNTSKVTDMSGMFYLNTGLTDLDLSKFNTSNVTDMGYMFQSTKLKNLDLSSFNTGKVTTMLNMFSGVTTLESLKLGSDFKFTNKNAALGKAAADYETTGNWQKDDESTDGYTPDDFMTKYGTGELTAGTYVAEKEKVDEPQVWGTAPWTFDSATGELKVEAGNLDPQDPTKGTGSPWTRTDDKKIKTTDIKTITFEGNVVAPENSYSLFGNGQGSGLKKLAKINGLDKLDTSKVTDMSSMFAEDSALTDLDLSSFNTSKVTNMHAMFSVMTNVKKLDLSSFNTSEVTDMSSMFTSDSALTDLDISSFVTSNVTTMSDMFAETALTKLDLSKFDTSKVTDMAAMFTFMTEITELDLSSFDTSKVTSMKGMMSGDSALKNINISSFDTSSVTDMGHMLNNDNSLEKMVLGDKFKFISNSNNEYVDAALGKAHADYETTGNWQNINEFKKSYTPEDFMAKYGTGDLTAGTYVAARVVKQVADLDVSAEFDKPSYTIGDPITTTVTIKHKDDSTLKAKAVRLSDLKSFALKNAQKLPDSVKIETFASDGTSRGTMEWDLDTQPMQIQNLDVGEYCKITINGTAINNTNSKDETNCDLSLSYSDEGNTDHTAEWAGKGDIESGALSIEPGTKDLAFKDTDVPATNELNGKTIDRKDSDWGINISDKRGTNPTGTDQKAQRQNWKLNVSTEDFKDKDDQDIPNSVLGIVFIGDDDNQIQIDGEPQTITDHDVSGENPIDNIETPLKWDAAKGFKAIVKDGQQLLDANEYHADMTFELTSNLNDV